MDLTGAYPKISLKAARVNANLSQAEAAKRIGVCKSTLQSYEKGETVPDWETVDEIAKVYHFPASLIFFSRKLAYSEQETNDQKKIPPPNADRPVS